MNVIPKIILVLISIYVPSVGCAAIAQSGGTEASQPEPIREFVDTTIRPSSGKTILVKSGGDFQEALDDAQLGDTIVLEAGATFTGPFTLSNKRSGSGWITIRSSAVEKDKRFPAPGTRVSPAHAPLMARLVSRKGGGVVLAERGAHHYRFIGIEVRPQDDTYLYSLMWLGSNKERSIDELPHHIIIDRCYLHGDPKKGSRRGVAMNGRHIAVIDSHLTDFKEVGADSQAIMGWGGTGPFKIVNNHLEAAAENLYFGGGDPSIPDLVPSDIEVRNNYMTKPLSWKRGEAGYDGTSWTIKNLFELKNARRVVVDGNILENSWEESQSGFAILFTVRNQDGRAPWSAIEDVQFTNNIIRHSGSGINLLGHDNNQPYDQSVETKRILIKNNLWEDIGGPRWGGRGILFQMLEGTSDVTIESNTGMQTGSVLYSEGPPHKRFVFRSNVAPHNELGIHGRGVGIGQPALEAFFPGALIVGNWIVGGDQRKYPGGNMFPPSVDAPSSDGPRTADRMFASVRKDTSAVRDETKPGMDREALCRALGSLSREERVCD